VNSKVCTSKASKPKIQLAKQVHSVRAGVSIVICCHNSSRLLPETLACLAAQTFSGNAPPWEVIVVDNASTDHTAKTATACWPGDTRIPLRVVDEPKLGLTSARLRGIREAQYEFICFVDDDNRVSVDWIDKFFRVMIEHPEIGACGGQVQAAPETDLPPWFDRFQSYYAVGQQAGGAGDVTEARGYLWGAGLCLRKTAWDKLAENHFTFLLSDRSGNSLSSGGDAELCYALRLSGWRLWYEPQLTMSHFLPAARLQWSYLRRLSRAFGAATLSLDAYEFALKGEPRGILDRLRRTWSWQTLATLKYLWRRPLKLLSAPFSLKEGDPEVLRIENLWGRLTALLRQRQAYAANQRRVLNDRRSR
jgi:glycosyltransferase involved in cell wall biosynthesis